MAHRENAINGHIATGGGCGLDCHHTPSPLDGSDARNDGYVINSIRRDVDLDDGGHDVALGGSTGHEIY